MYDVLHDADYRRCWDDNMLECFEICQLDRYNDIGYYSSKSIYLYPDVSCGLVLRVQALAVSLCCRCLTLGKMLNSYSTALLLGVFGCWQVCLGYFTKMLEHYL